MPKVQRMFGATGNHREAINKVARPFSTKFLRDLCRALPAVVHRGR